MEQPPCYTPQAISDILPIYRPNDADNHIQIYNLRQPSADIQTLTLCHDQTHTTLYTIKTFKTGGFLNRKPHVIISGRDRNQRIAEGRFDVHGTGTTISYADPPSTQRLELESSLTQLLTTTVNGHDHWWQPFPGNKSVLELTNEMAEIVARFIYAEPVSQITAAGAAVKKDSTSIEVGQLHLVEELAGGETGRDEILGSAILVIERAKRRAANIGAQGTGFKQAAAWGRSNSVPGGFL